MFPRRAIGWRSGSRPTPQQREQHHLDQQGRRIRPCGAASRHGGCGRIHPSRPPARAPRSSRWRSPEPDPRRWFRLTPTTRCPLSP